MRLKLHFKPQRHNENSEKTEFSSSFILKSVVEIARTLRCPEGYAALGWDRPIQRAAQGERNNPRRVSANFLLPTWSSSTGQDELFSLTHCIYSPCGNFSF